MAKKKENLPVEENLTENVVAESAIAEETPVQQEEQTVAEAQPSVEDKPSFWQKVKMFFVKIGRKIKSTFVGWWQKIKSSFEKDKSLQNDEELQRILNDLPADLKKGTQLTKGEKAKRFLQSQSGWLFVLPAVILMCIFTLYPIVNAFIGAFMENYNTLNVDQPYTGWGFENFVRVLKGDTGTGGATFVQCLVNTTVFTLISVPLSTLLALLISVGLNSIKPLQKAYQTVLFLPYLTNALAMGAVFATFFSIVGTVKNPESVGLFNNFLSLFGVEPIDWIKGGSEVTWSISNNLVIPWSRYIVIIVYEVWSGLPFKILILFSALQSVNKQYYDAAKIDGASRFTVLTKITTPMISPMISYLIVTGIMGGMKQYTAVVGIFGGRDKLNMYNVNTVVGYIYQYVETSDMGFAFAGSLLLFFIIMAFTAINRYVSKKRVTF